MIPALLKWIGNKQRFAEIIIKHMPDDFNDYYEPFLGSGAVMAELIAASKTGRPQFNKAYGSDVLPFLMDVFEIVKNNPELITEYYRKEIEDYYVHPDEKYYEIRDRFNKDFNTLDFCLLSRTCYSGVIRFRKADGYMSTRSGPHKPISPDTFEKRVRLWHDLLQRAEFDCIDYKNAMDKAKKGDLIYCDPPYTHSQGIIYGAQEFKVDELFDKIKECKDRGVYVMLSINGMRDSKKKDISVTPPRGLFERRLLINCGTSMIDRLQSSGRAMIEKKVDDQLLLTWR